MLTGSAAYPRSGVAPNAVAATTPPALLVRMSRRENRFESVGAALCRPSMAALCGSATPVKIFFIRSSLQTTIAAAPKSSKSGKPSGAPRPNSVASRSGGTMKYTLALAVAALLHAGAPGMAAEINVMSGGAPKEVLAALIPQFEKQTGHRVKVTYAVIAALQQKLASGERPDMVLLPTSAIADQAKAGRLNSEGSAPFGRI